MNEQADARPDGRGNMRSSPGNYSSYTQLHDSTFRPTYLQQG